MNIMILQRVIFRGRDVEELIRVEADGGVST